MAKQEPDTNQSAGLGMLGRVIDRSTLNLVMVVGLYAVSYFAFLAGPYPFGAMLRSEGTNASVAVVICFVPFLLYAWGVLSLMQQIKDGAGKLGVGAGALGAAVILGLEGYGAYAMNAGTGPTFEYRPLALVVGVAMVGVYAYFALRFFREA
ncbi:MAG: hypothetical protein AB7S26_07445 [Sandaracinaceae bacterium]